MGVNVLSRVRQAAWDQHHPLERHSPALFTCVALLATFLYACARILEILALLSSSPIYNDAGYVRVWILMPGYDFQI